MNWLSYSANEVIPGFDTRLLTAHRADEHLCDSDGAARCSLWWTNVPELPDEKIGLIGHFSAISALAGTSLLRAAVARLRDLGCSLAIGPMDGNTWRRHRVLTERGDEAVFFMEPDNPDWWRTAFEQAAFVPLSNYSSSMVCDLTRHDSRAARTRERLETTGIKVRHLDATNFENDLRKIYEISVVSFSGNYLYTEIPEADFMAQYLPYRDRIRPELILIAECDGKAVGYLFAVPDFAEAMRGEPIRTVIGKTLAILPGRQFAGLGVVLTDMIHSTAADMGYSRLIHALQHEGNQVRNMSGFFGLKMRRYTLYSHHLEK